MFVEPCSDPLLEISPSAGYSDLPVDYGTKATRARMRACAKNVTVRLGRSRRSRLSRLVARARRTRRSLAAGWHEDLDGLIVIADGAESVLSRSRRAEPRTTGGIN